jgi:hypothetical protein
MRLRQLDRRVRLLEAAIAGRETHDPFLILVDFPSLQGDFPADERLVIDRFRNSGSTIWGYERIASDPADQGRTCEPGGCIEALLERFHQDCH